MDDLLTHTLVITPAILKLIAEIDEFKGAWTAIGRISPERLTALQLSSYAGHNGKTHPIMEFVN